MKTTVVRYQANVDRAAVDLCPVTGRGRLSYERAEYLFKQGSLKVASRVGRCTSCATPP